MRKSVQEVLATSRWAHFACHAEAVIGDPSKSRLLLHDHAAAPLTVLDVARLRLGHAELAFLSACSTARPGDRLADEVIHLVSAFQLAGYRHVIGTIWPVGDLVALQVATGVYHTLAGTRAADATTRTADEAALALHFASRRLRSATPTRPSAWAAHIHAGP